MQHINIIKSESLNSNLASLENTKEGENSN